MLSGKWQIPILLTGILFFSAVFAGMAGARQDDIFGMLKKDHAYAKKTLKQLKNGRDGELFKNVQQMLTVHMQFEEENLYPVLQRNQATSQIVAQAMDEHNMIRQVMVSMAHVGQGNRDQWIAKVNELDQLMKTHIKNEESKLFKAARKAISKDQARQMAMQYQQMKSEAGMAGAKGPEERQEPSGYPGQPSSPGQQRHPGMQQQPQPQQQRDLPYAGRQAKGIMERGPDPPFSNLLSDQGRDRRAAAHIGLPSGGAPEGQGNLLECTMNEEKSF